MSGKVEREITRHCARHLVHMASLCQGLDSSTGGVAGIDVHWRGEAPFQVGDGQTN